MRGPRVEHRDSADFVFEVSAVVDTERHPITKCVVEKAFLPEYIVNTQESKYT